MSDSEEKHDEPEENIILEEAAKTAEVLLKFYAQLGILPPRTGWF